MSWPANVNNKGGDLWEIWLLDRAKCQTWCVWRVSCQTKGGSVGPGLIKFKLGKSLRNLIDYLHKAKCWKAGGCRISCQAKGGSVCPAQAPSNQPIKFFALLWFITRLMLMVMGPLVTSWLDINSSHISGDSEQKVKKKGILRKKMLWNVRL